MKIDAVSTVGYALQTLQQDIDPLKAKVIAAAVIAFAFLAAALAIFWAYFRKEAPSIPTEKALSNITESVTTSFSNAQKLVSKLISAKCFVRLNFEKGEIKKEFIIQNGAKGELDDSFIKEQAEKIRAYVAPQVIEYLGADLPANDILGKCKICQIATFYYYPKVDNPYDGALPTFEAELCWQNAGKDPTIISDLHFPALADKHSTVYSCVVKDMGFPDELHFKDGAFLQGKHFQAL